MIILIFGLAVIILTSIAFIMLISNSEGKVGKKDIAMFFAGCALFIGITAHTALSAEIHAENAAADGSHAAMNQ